MNQSVWWNVLRFYCFNSAPYVANYLIPGCCCSLCWSIGTYLKSQWNLWWVLLHHPPKRRPTHKSKPHFIQNEFQLNLSKSNKHIHQGSWFTQNIHVSLTNNHGRRLAGLKHLRVVEHLRVLTWGFRWWGKEKTVFAPTLLGTNIWGFPKMVVPPNQILMGFSIINHPFWGTPIFGNTHIPF